MILDRPRVVEADLEAAGWELKPEGACKAGLCVPLPPRADGGWEAEDLARRLHSPLVHDQAAGLWALGPPAGPRLDSALAPDFVLPDWRGQEFRLSSLRGVRVFVLAWAPW